MTPRSKKPAKRVPLKAVASWKSERESVLSAASPSPWESLGLNKRFKAESEGAVLILAPNCFLGSLCVCLREEHGVRK